MTMFRDIVVHSKVKHVLELIKQGCNRDSESGEGANNAIYW